ncbi:DMT family transporter [Actinocorallia longicatena]|uniref:DMT family transporter n=1 Tax=Actinocorallia longicatena TaxID=111803 RepID=A0ABP6QC30_9ACTN
MTQTVSPPAAATGRPWAALAAVTVTVLAWASAFVVIRSVGEDFGPGPLSLGRLLIGSIVLGGILLARRTWVTPTRREWGFAVLCGLGWFGVYNVALNAAEQRIDAGTAAMLVNVGPILIALLAGYFLKEGYPRWLLIGAAVAFGGAVLIGVATSHDSGTDLAGVLLCLVAAVTYAIGVVSQKPIVRRIPPLQAVWMSCTIAAVACLFYLPGLASDLGGASGGSISGLLYLGLVPTALAFTTWGYALSRMNAGRLGVTTYVVPPLTIVMALVLLDESPAVLALAGGVVCLVGVALSRRASR